MHGEEASVNSAALGKLQAYALDGSPAAAVAARWCLWLGKWHAEHYETADVGSP
jgi:hypothetical protein